MRVPALAAGCACAAMLALASAAMAAPVFNFTTVHREAEATVQVSGVPQTDLKQSDSLSKFDQTASTVSASGNLTLSATAVHQSDLAPTSISSSGQLSYRVAGVTDASTGALSRALLQLAFTLDTPLNYTLHANMGTPGAASFTGALHLQRSGADLINETINAGNDDVLRSGVLQTGDYSLTFLPSTEIKGTNGTDVVQFSLFMEASPTVIPLPPAAWAGLAPLAIAGLLVWRSTRAIRA